jgi:hypothetical protein
MGVTYKFKDEVVEFIISQKQADPTCSCRQLAESASEKFALKLSKSSVHDVLKNAGIINPRGRKPKDKFEIPEEKKKQIQTSLSQVKIEPSLVPEPLLPDPVIVATVSEPPAPTEIISIKEEVKEEVKEKPLPIEEEFEISESYEGAGKIFYKAVQWDLGIFSEGHIKERDWDYYLTYAKGIIVNLENNQSFFIELPIPIERCVRETADGFVNNVRPFLVHKVSSQEIFQACMEGKTGFTMSSVVIVGHSDHILSEFDFIVEKKRTFILKDRMFVESKDRNFIERVKNIFFSQDINLDVINELLNISGIDKISKEENVVKLLIQEGYEHKNLLEQAVLRLNNMLLRDDQDRLVRIEI